MKVKTYIVQTGNYTGAIEAKDESAAVIKAIKAMGNHTLGALVSCVESGGLENDTVYFLTTKMIEKAGGKFLRERRNSKNINLP